jgi:hypothetical protein
MISLETLKTGVSKAPPRILLYGEEKIGKTTFAANAPNPVFLRTEDGEGKLDLTSWDIKSFEDFLDAIGVLATQKHDFQTVVIDTLDWFEPIVWKQLIRDRPKSEKGAVIENIDDYGFGKGYGFAMDYWVQIIDCLNALRNERNMMVIMLAHSHIKSYSPPDGSSYDRFTLKMNEKASEKFMEFSDAIFFAKKKMFLADDEGKKGDKNAKKKAVGSSDGREIMTESLPSFRAGNRYNLPASLPFDANVWNLISKDIPYFEKFK